MLVIERRAGELVRIGDEIQVHVLDSDGDTVRLGIDAPRDIAVRAVDATQPAPTLVEQENDGNTRTPRKEGDES